MDNEFTTSLTLKQLNFFPESTFENDHPLLTGSFFKLLETSGSVSINTGWAAQHISNNQSILPGYIKNHSYGEYIFDWSWAEFYDHHGLNYYPKLVHAIPYTPVNANKVLGNPKDFKDLSQASFDRYKELNLSSEHYLFIDQIEANILKSNGFSIQETIQFHFHNIYTDFQSYLDHLKKNRRKSIKKERTKINSYNLEIKQLTGEELTPDILSKFYSLYLATIYKKSSYAYLSKEFFLQLSQKLNEKTLLICAYKDDLPIAMSLFFYGENSLYGRYWGILPEFENKYPLLHFELCYYQGIEFCIKNDLALFEAGAQGEQKLFRGFRPTKILSAHHINNNQCFSVIKKAILEQNNHTDDQIEYLNRYLPLKI